MDIYRTITGIGLMILLCACQDVGMDSTHTSTTSTTEPMSGTDYITKEKARLKSLLSSFSQPLKDAEVAVDLTDRGALYAHAYAVEGKPIMAIAYLFETQEKHTEVFEYLKSQYDDGKFYTLISSNGGWLLWAYSEKEEAALEYVVSDLVAAFAGEE